MARRHEVVRAAGGVVLRRRARGLEVLVVHRPRYDDWSLPKGKLDPGETFQQAAIREVEEETGVVGRLGAELPTTHYADRQGRPKVVRWWRMHQADADPHEADAEVDVVTWIPVSEAPARLTYAADADLLAQAIAEPPPVSILLVRHAHAGRRSRWNGDDRRRPLSDRGQAQSHGLVEVLSAWHVDRLVSSPLTRCVQTLAPLGDARGTSVETDDRLAEGATLDGALALLAEAPDGSVLCSHGDVIGELVEHLADEHRVGDLAGERLRWQKGSTWVLTRAGDAITAATYLPPPDR